MILFLIGLLIIVALLGFMILAVSTVGAAGIIVFSDVIVCAFILVWIIKKIIAKKKK